jgi:hypothetical protein
LKQIFSGHCQKYDGKNLINLWYQPAAAGKYAEWWPAQKQARIYSENIF